MRDACSSEIRPRSTHCLDSAHSQRISLRILLLFVRASYTCFRKSVHRKKISEHRGKSEGRIPKPEGNPNNELPKSEKFIAGRIAVEASGAINGILGRGCDCPDRVP